MNTQLVETNARQWLRAIVRQGERLWEASDKEFRARSSEDNDRLAIDDLRDWVRSEEHFFVIAVGKAIDWVRELKSIDQNRSVPIEDFLNKLPGARDMRNMREHDNEYLQGKGWKQPSFHQKVTGYDTDVKISADATAMKNRRKRKKRWKRGGSRQRVVFGSRPCGVIPAQGQAGKKREKRVRFS